MLFRPGRNRPRARPAARTFPASAACAAAAALGLPVLALGGIEMPEDLAAAADAGAAGVAGIRAFLVPAGAASRPRPRGGAGREESRLSVVGLGLDVVDLGRIRDLYARHGERFTRRNLPGGRDPAAPGRRPDRAPRRPLRRQGGGAQGARHRLGPGHLLRMVEVVRERGGAPGIRLHDAAAARAAALGATRTLLSISHERTFAAAVAVLEANPL